MEFFTILFGNGIGRAANNDYFLLETGIRSAWEDQNVVDESTKESILACIPSNSDGSTPNYPTSEDQLAILHKAVSACNTLSLLEEQNEVERRWLSEHGKDFPRNVQKFISHVAKYFHDYSAYDDDHYSEFVESLSNFIKERRTHLVTLNYDNLLYQPLVEEEILKGFTKGHLIDGFTDQKGFDRSNLVRFKDWMGWYIHLHGSPLFLEKESKIVKVKEANFDDSFTSHPYNKRHVVLSHTQDKPEIIASSHLLATY